MKIYLISRPSINEEGLSSFLNDEAQKWKRSNEADDSESIVEIAGRVCHMSFGDKQHSSSNRDFIGNLISKQHDSVLEHASWTFIATGITRSLTHQIVRHRIGFSYSQMSQQYTDQTMFHFVIPPGTEKNEKIKLELDKIQKMSMEAYSSLMKILEEQRPIDEKKESNKTKYFIRSAARSVLPNSMETKLVFSANGRSLRHFLKLRGNIDWDLEMRLFCHELLIIMQKEAKSIFNDFSINIHEDGYPIILHNKNTKSNS